MSFIRYLAKNVTSMPAHAVYRLPPPPPQKTKVRPSVTTVSYRMFIKYCVFSLILKYIPDSVLSLFSLSVSVCTHTGQV